MSEEKEKREYINTLIINARRGFRIRGALSLLAWLFFAISVILKLLFSKGIVSSVLSLAHVEIVHYLFFSPDALREVAKTVGVFSVFIAWIYAELGKYELGFQYTELLATFCEHYHLHALSYILAILACIYITTIDILESAGIAMVIAALGLWDQARILVSFIFNSKVRKELAIEKWRQRFKEMTDGKSVISLSDLYKLADNISVKDIYFDKLCSCLSEGVLAFLKHSSSSASDESMNIIDISHVWDRMLDGRPNHERSILLYNVLKHINEILHCDDDKKKQIIICAGYLQRQIRYYTKMSCPVSDKDSNMLIHVLSDISQLQHKLGNAQADKQMEIIDCLDTLYALLIWMYFLCNNIVFDQDLQAFITRYKQVYGEHFKDVFEAFIRCTFDNEACENYYNTAWHQVGRLSSD